MNVLIPSLSVTVGATQVAVAEVSPGDTIIVKSEGQFIISGSSLSVDAKKKTNNKRSYCLMGACMYFLQK